MKNESYEQTGKFYSSKPAKFVIGLSIAGAMLGLLGSSLMIYSFFMTNNLALLVLGIICFILVGVLIQLIYSYWKGKKSGYILEDKELICKTGCHLVRIPYHNIISMAVKDYAF
jgi:uncharacterized membrane protein YdbT with pleckstrin-like domain